MTTIPNILQMHWFWGDLPQWGAWNVAEWSEALAPLGWSVEVVQEVPGDLPARYRAVLDDPPTARFRADMLRYWLMYKRGGLYVDMDTRPAGGVTTLNELAAAAADAVCLPATRVGGVCLVDNCLMLAAPGNEFWLGCLERCLDRDGWVKPGSWYGGCNVFGFDVFGGASPDGVRILADGVVSEVTANERKWHLLGRREDLGDKREAVLRHYRVSRAGALATLLEERDYGVL
jgi:hypothetical protein